MRINVPVTIAAFIGLFIVGVVALTVLGKPLLTELSFDNTTVGYIDLARQAATKRDYAKADGFYKEAISNAERVSPDGANTVFALVTYAEYLKSRKRPAEALIYETRAYRISHP